MNAFGNAQSAKQHSQSELNSYHKRKHKMNPWPAQPRLVEILGTMTLYFDCGHSTTIPYVSEAQIPHKGESVYCFSCMAETAVSGMVIELNTETA